MEWSEPGIIIGTRKHGESSVIVEIFTAEHGRHMGLVRGGRGRRMRSVLQPGNRVLATWRARLSDHLGHFLVEPEQLDAALYMADPLRLAALNTINELVRLLPERDAHDHLHAAYIHILDYILGDQGWADEFVRWQLLLLQELGFGLDLTCCAATGEVDNLLYVSPKSGRAVGAGAGEPYKDRLLPLPQFLVHDQHSNPGWSDVKAGLRLAGYFFTRHVYEPRGIDPPESGERMNRLLAKHYEEDTSNGR
jgi:DNA repair protein RecO (recombination protein O)